MPRGKQLGLAVRLGDAAARQLEVIRPDLDADEGAAEPGAGHTRRAAAHEWVEHCLEGTMYRGAEPTLEGGLTPEILSRAIARLPEGAYVPKDQGRPPPPPVMEDFNAGLRKIPHPR
jgi:hypothetical protein